MYYKVTDEPNLVRDANSKAILNVNTDALNKYKKEKEEKMKLKNVIDGFDNLKNELQVTKNDISEIKQMLMQLMEKK